MFISEGVELVSFRQLAEGNLQVQMAVKGQLAPSIDDHKSNMERFRSDEEYFRHMARQSELLIHLFGDARYPLPESLAAAKSEEGF